MTLRRSLPQTVAWALLAILPAGAFALLQNRADLNVELAAPAGHFYIVSAVAVIAVALSVIALVAAARTPDLRLLLLALAFVSMAGIFAVHGLTTPGFIVDAQYFTVVGFSARLSVLTATVLLAASTFNPPRALEQLLVQRRAGVAIG